MLCLSSAVPLLTLLAHFIALNLFSLAQTLFLKLPLWTWCRILDSLRMVSQLPFPDAKLPQLACIWSSKFLVSRNHAIFCLSLKSNVLLQHGLISYLGHLVNRSYINQLSKELGFCIKWNFWVAWNQKCGSRNLSFPSGNWCKFLQSSSVLKVVLSARVMPVLDWTW